MFQLLFHQSAYFVIAEDSKHGENLVCSYYACRNGGVKFRYCAYCMAPVAKRNFSRRHDHGMSKKKGAASIKDDEEDEEDDDTVDESEMTVSDRGSLIGYVVSSNSSAAAKKKEPVEEDTTKRQSESVPLEETVEEEDFSSERREMWHNLLSKRPSSKDPKGLSKWLSEVLSVSDLQFPLEKVGAENAREGSPLGKVLSNELSKLTKPTVPDEDTASGPMDSSAMDTTNSSSTTVDSLKDTAKSATQDQNEKTPVKDNTVTASNSKSDMKSLKKNLANKKRKKGSDDDDDDDDDSDSDEGFAGSFADWRDRKKGKSLKKGSSSLRK